MNCSQTQSTSERGGGRDSGTGHRFYSLGGFTLPELGVGRVTLSPRHVWEVQVHLQGMPLGDATLGSNLVSPLASSAAPLWPRLPSEAGVRTGRGL